MKFLAQEFVYVFCLKYMYVAKVRHDYMPLTVNVLYMHFVRDKTLEPDKQKSYAVLHERYHFFYRRLSCSTIAYELKNILEFD